MQHRIKEGSHARALHIEEEQSIVSLADGVMTLLIVNLRQLLSLNRVQRLLRGDEQLRLVAIAGARLKHVTAGKGVRGV